MPSFYYRAINEESGENVRGTLEAESMDTANAMIFSRGLIPFKLSQRDVPQESEWAGKITSMFTGKVNATDLIIFTKQFRSMINAGVPILRILQILELQTESPILKKAIPKVIQDIRQGASISESLEKHPNIFSSLYCSMIKAGELSGNLPSVLDRLIYIIDHEAKVRNDIKSALRYPVIVLVALAAAFVILLTFVIPQFVGIFKSAQIELPLPTKVAILLSNMIKNYWYIILGTLIVVVLAFRAYFRTENGRYARDSFLLKIPIVGPLLQKSALSRFASIFAILQSSGVPVIQSLGILSDTIGNAAISRDFEHIRENIEQGSGISAPLKSAKYFTPMVVDMIAIGEESGNIDEMLREVTKHYDDEVEYAVKGLSDALGPILMVGLAAVVLFFALAIFLPMWDLTKMATRH